MRVTGAGRRLRRGERMRWDDLFRDLEAQLEAAAAAELDAEVADRTRREAAQLALVDRARAAVGHPVTLRVLGAGPVDGLLADVGAQWLLLAEPSGRQALVPSSAVLSLAGLRAWTSVPGEGGQVFARLGLGSALRGIARDRLPVQVVPHRRQRAGGHPGPGGFGLRRADRARRGTPARRGHRRPHGPVRRPRPAAQRALIGRLRRSYCSSSAPAGATSWPGSSSDRPNRWVDTNSRVWSYIRAM